MSTPRAEYGFERCAYGEGCRPSPHATALSSRPPVFALHSVQRAEHPIRSRLGPAFAVYHLPDHARNARETRVQRAGGGATADRTPRPGQQVLDAADAVGPGHTHVH